MMTFYKLLYMQLETVTLHRIVSCETRENVVGPGLCRLGWGCGWACGCRLWVGLWVLWVRHTPLEYLHQLSDSMPKRMRLEANGNPLKYYLGVRLNCKTVLNPEIKYICINISFYIDLKVKGTG